MDAYTIEEAAFLLGVTTRTLGDWRRTGKGPAFIKIGKSIRYPKEAFVDFIAENTFVPEPAQPTQPLFGLLGGFDLEHQPA